MKPFNCVETIAILVCKQISSNLFRNEIVVYSYADACRNIMMQWRRVDTYLEKYTSHFIWKGVGDQTELQHIDPHSYGHNNVSFPFSWAAQPGAWPLCWVLGLWSHLLFNWSEALNSNCSIRGSEGPLCWVLVLFTASYLQLIWISCRRGYIIIWCPLFFLRTSQFRTQFNPPTVKVISWYSSTGCTYYLHRCISYFDSLAGSEVNIQENYNNFIYFWLNEISSNEANMIRWKKTLCFSFYLALLVIIWEISQRF